MKAFEDLTHRGQVRRLRHLAQAALQHYGLGDAQLVFVAYSENAVFRVDTPQESVHAGKRYSLRVHRPGHQTEASLDSELVWMAALKRQAKLPVPEPQLSLDGRLRVQVSVHGISGPRNCSLLSWMRGRRVIHGARPAHFFAIGELIARLHEHASHWQPPAGFTRRHWDWEGLFGDRAGLDLSASKVWALLPDRYRAPFEAVAGQVQHVMNEWGKDPDAFGLLHADLSVGEEGNVLFHKGQAQPIDFDDCGFGYWIYDLAVPLAHWQTTPQWAAYRQALLDGYTRVRPSLGAPLDYLDLFMAARHVSEMLWAIDQAQHNALFCQELDGWLKWSMAHVQLYLGKEAL